MFTNLLLSGDNHNHPELHPSNVETPLDPAGLFDIFGEFDPSVVSDNITDLSFLDDASMTDAAKHKRSLTADHEEDDNTSNDAVSSSKDVVCATRKPRQKKPRRPTHVMVKETREKLHAQIQHLELQAALLRQQVGVADPEVLAAKKVVNDTLRDAVLQHDLQVASTQSAFSGYLNSRATNPLESYIHLGMGWDQRRSVLLEMKDRKIAVAHQFLTKRTHHMNPFKPSCEVSTFETEQGDMCTVKVDVTPFEGVKNVREVFKALQFYFANMEISKTELSGKVTIRENEVSADDLVMQHRIVTSEEQGVSQESNVVMFYDVSGLSTENADEQCVVMASDFVDRDDIYPYRSSERVRKDASSAMKLSTHRRRQSYTTSSNDDDAEDEFVVVLTRAFFVRLHRPQFGIPEPVLQTISDEVPDSIDVMIQSTQSGLQQMSMHSTQ